jgi:dTDP-D-glucose 4,6-dehydratase
MSLIDFRSVLQAIDKVKPDEIYNLAGQTSVGLSFEQPVETFNSITVGTLNLLEVLRFYNLTDQALQCLFKRVLWRYRWLCSQRSDPISSTQPIRCSQVGRILGG